MVSAAFTVDGVSNPAEHTTTYGATVALALASVTGVSTITWTIDSISEPSASYPTITAAGSPIGSTASFPFPSNPGDGRGRTILVRCYVTGANGTSDSKSAIVGVANSQGVIPIAPGETDERNATHGWLPALNTALNSGAASATNSSNLIPARAASTVNIASLSGTMTLGGVSVIADDRVLLTAQTTTSQNGPWVVKAGAWQRPTDFDASGDVVSGQTISVAQGTYSGSVWVLTSAGPFTLGTTALVWSRDSNGSTASAQSLVDLVITAPGSSHSGLSAIDGVTPVAGQYVLDVGHATPALRGPWVFQGGAWTRPTDITTVPGLVITVRSGTFGIGRQYVLSAATPFTIGVTAQDWIRTDGGGQSGTVVTASTAQTLIGELTVPDGMNFLVEVVAINWRAADTKLFSYFLIGSSDAAGTVTLGSQKQVYADSSIYGTIDFGVTTRKVRVFANPADATSTSWHAYRFQMSNY
jgi:hypothetical protein